LGVTGKAEAGYRGVWMIGGKGLGLCVFEVTSSRVWRVGVGDVLNVDGAPVAVLAWAVCL
jgi:hypothetical protein